MLTNVGIRINELNQFFSDPPYSDNLKSQKLINIHELIKIIKFNNIHNKAGHLVSFLTNEYKA